MKISNKLRNILKATLVTLLVTALLMVLGAGKTQAIPYGSPAPTTPAFNIYTGVPYGIGDESDFVRLRDSNGDPTVSPNQNSFVDPYDSSCNVGDMFDIRTYIHNGASADSNDNGNGTAVAHNVVLNMNAPLGQDNDQFVFDSTISASNAASVSDTGTLNCGKDAVLELVPQTVSVYSAAYGWQTAPDSAVNGSLPIGSDAFGSGDVWGCWASRVVVVYTVRVIPVEVPSSALCEVLDMTVIGDRKIRVTVQGETDNATIIDYRIEWGDGSETNKQTAMHKYSQDGNYTITGFVRARYANGDTEWLTGDACQAQVTFSPEKAPVVTTIPNTGIGSLAGVFAATTVGGAIAHRLRSLRKLGR